VYNNTVHTSTRQTSFYANYGYYPKFDLLYIFEMNNPTAKDLASRLLELQETMKFHIQEAQDRYKTSANTLCKEAPLFQVGEKVWLIRRNIKTT